MRKAIYVVTLGLLALPLPAMAQHRGSMEDQMACTPDVYKLCSQNIPDEDAITACLRQHKAQLSAGCKAVFSRPDTAAAPKKDDDDD